MKHPDHGLYEQLKSAWIQSNINSTPAEYEAAIRAIARWCGV